eukprot:NODE_6548_length_872_cov_35.882510_g5953_i0.p1 GENE.NODE_6548_length_872_cov_35.882510_g5953_i0~~NODE_6548_length_872_cov_35.882510_g5953_i0.p1  ORF type:complete len:224 (-),score=35.50 NODE_6548_length_872_cov_35.882510_g5953_i0:148-819(-)
MPRVLITGANRGLGAEFVRQYVADGWDIVACCREPGELTEIRYEKLVIKPLDVSDFQQMEKLALELKGLPIDVLINNAGVLHVAPLNSIDYDKWAESFKVNTMAPVRMTELFLDNLLASEKRTVALISSLMGSIDDNGSGESYIYRSTKAALNMCGKSLSIDLKDKGVKILIFHPGWVPTRMGGPRGVHDQSESIKGMKSLIETTTIADTGRFLWFSGEEIKW